MTPAGCGLPSALWPWPQPSGLDVSWFEICPVGVLYSRQWQMVLGSVTSSLPGDMELLGARSHGVALLWLCRRALEGLGRLAVVAQHSRQPTLSACSCTKPHCQRSPGELDGFSWEEREIEDTCFAKPALPGPPVPVLTDIRRCWADNVTALRAR